MADLGETLIPPRAAFSYPNFVRFLQARLFIVLALEMQSVAVGWQVYEITKRPLDLGLVGLAQFFPSVLLFLAAGHAADRFNRRKVLVLCQIAYGICSVLFLTMTLSGVHTVAPIYATLILLGISRSFNNPTGQALLPQLIPAEYYPNAVAWGSSAFQGATIFGPMIGGLIYAFFRGPSGVYGVAALLSLFAVFCTLRIQAIGPSRARNEAITLKSTLAGFHYVRENKVILGSISLDLFAVLLGGAVALLPVYAREILKTGPWGLGILRSAPGIGAAIIGVALAYKPLRRRAGATMFFCVAGFGVFTILFGISHNFLLSLFALLMVGATDMVSVVIRSTLVQLSTPDEMRGRVSAINYLFIGTSNEFGQFESGLTAQWFGTVPAVVLGGVGTLLVVAVWAWRFPQLRRADRMGEVLTEETSASEITSAVKGA